MTAASVADASPPASGGLVNASIMIVAGIVATTLAQSGVLAHLPLQNLLKNELHASRSANAAFFFLSGLPWYFKPFAGILTDAFPIFGSRRKSYLVISAALGGLCWFALLLVPHQYNALLWMSIVISAFMVVSSTVVGGFLVETAQAMAGSGRLTALRQLSQSACVVVAGPGGGYLASINFGWTCGICGGVMLVLVPATLLFLYELRRRTDSSRVLAAAGEQLTRIGTAGTMWAAAGLIAFFYMAPGLITALFYKQQNELHMTTQGQGFLSLLGGIGGISATIVYGFACQRFSLRTMLLASISMAAVLTPALLFYNSVLMAQIIAAGAGFFGILVLLALMDLAVRATPRGSESLGYSLLVSVYNLVRFGADWVGSLLLDKYHFQFSWLVWANVATAVLAIPLVLLMPRVLVRSRDGERAEDLAEAAEGMPAAAEAVATG